MRAVIQRVTSASVKTESGTAGAIGSGIVLFAGCEEGDTNSDFEWIARKCADLRLFSDDSADGHFEKSLRDIGGAILAVSQFTLLGDARKGRRPSFSKAMPVDQAREAFEIFLNTLKETGLEVASGEFQAMMKVELVNDGPVTILLDSRKRF